MERVAVVNVLRQQVHAVEHYPLVVGQRAGTGPIVEQGDVKAGRLVLNGRSKVSGHVSVVRMTLLIITIPLGSSVHHNRLLPFGQFD